MNYSEPTWNVIEFYLLRKERDEVPLEHWLEKCIDRAVLVMLHRLQQLLHELYLVLFGPRGEIVHANITFFQILWAGLPGQRLGGV